MKMSNGKAGALPARCVCSAYLHVLAEEVVYRLSDILERGGNWLGHSEGYGWREG